MQGGSGACEVDEWGMPYATPVRSFESCASLAAGGQKYLDICGFEEKLLPLPFQWTGQAFLLWGSLLNNGLTMYYTQHGTS